jgi:hypothetical protein
LKTRKTGKALFDAKSATCIQRRVAGSPHNAYEDNNGSLCLVCVGGSSGGGAPSNGNALRWLREKPGDKFIRFKNTNSGFDITIWLEDLPEKPMRDGPYGPYAFYDAADFRGGPPFPPGPGDDDGPM